MRPSRVRRALPQAARGARPETEWRKVFDAGLDEESSTAWPSEYYRLHPLEFMRDVLGVSLWAFQISVVLTVASSRLTGVAGGRKVGKSLALACVAIWYWATHEKARVILIAPKLEQIDEIIYLEIRQLMLGHGRCVKCKRDNPGGPTPCPHSKLLGGSLGVGCKTGLRAEDTRAIFGMVANPGGGGLRGISGGNMLVLVDEGCEVPDDHHRVIEGNIASATAKFVVSVNPTRTTGWAHKAFHEDAPSYRTDTGESSLLTCSSADNPNITEGANIPGLASREWVEERKILWGEHSRLYMSDVLGLWPVAERGQLFTLETLLKREAHYDTIQDQAAPEGRLSIGVDIAGAAKTGDKFAIAVRRGTRLLCPIWTSDEMDGPCTDDRLLDEVLVFVGRYRRSSDLDINRPRVTVDSDGKDGARIGDKFVGFARNNPGTMLVTEFHGGIPIKYGTKVEKQYKLTRDLLFGRLEDWVKGGGCWPRSLRLRQQLHALRWLEPENGKQVLIRKDDLRDILSCSPDELDALALSCWSHVDGLSVPEIDSPLAKKPAAQKEGGYQWNEDPRGDDFWGDSILRGR